MNDCQGWALGGGAMKAVLERGRTHDRRYYATELLGTRVNDTPRIIMKGNKMIMRFIPPI
jgi:hypothetical protein